MAFSVGAGGVRGVARIRVVGSAVAGSSRAPAGVDEDVAGMSCWTQLGGHTSWMVMQRERVRSSWPFRHASALACGPKPMASSQTAHPQGPPLSLYYSCSRHLARSQTRHGDQPLGEQSLRTTSPAKLPAATLAGTNTSLRTQFTMMALYTTALYTSPQSNPSAQWPAASGYRGLQLTTIQSTDPLTHTSTNPPFSISIHHSAGPNTSAPTATTPST